MNLTNNEKHYNTLSEYYKYKYGTKIAKIPLNGNFTCPNIDGTKGYGGCTYCSSLGSGDFAGDKNKSFKEQFEDISTIMKNKWNDCKFIPYLQANSNTYKPLDELKQIYDDVLASSHDIVAFSIATRPDCLDEEKCAYLGELNKKVPIQVELGLQTIHDKTAKLINRCSTLEEFENACKMLSKYNIEIVVHIINGLPYETKEDMIETVKYLNKFPISGIKIHSLLVLKKTKLYKDYLENPFKILTLEEYVDIVVMQIANLRSDIIIHRLAADGACDDVVYPTWSKKKLVIMNEIDKRLRKDNIYQGDYIKKVLFN